MINQSKLFTKPLKAKAFTLVELLVVIAVIAALMAIALPSLQNARRQARMVLCMTNSRQLALGLNNYAAEYSGKYPARNPISTRPWIIGQFEDEEGWVKIYLKYVIDYDAKLAWCPAQKKGARGPGISNADGSADPPGFPPATDEQLQWADYFFVAHANWQSPVNMGYSVWAGFMSRGGDPGNPGKMEIYRNNTLVATHGPKTAFNSNDVIISDINYLQNYHHAGIYSCYSAHSLYDGVCPPGHEPPFVPEHFFDNLNVAYADGHCEKHLFLEDYVNIICSSVMNGHPRYFHSY